MLFTFVVDASQIKLPELTSRDIRKLRQRATDYALEGLREHLEAQNSENFYQQAAESTERVSDADSDYIRVTQVGVWHNYTGGTIKAGRHASSATGKKTKWLAIPAIKGLLAPGFYKGKLRWQPTSKPDLALLVEATPKKSRYKKGKTQAKRSPKSAATKKKKTQAKRQKKQSQKKKSKVIYWLKKQVTIKPHPHILPTPEALQSDASTGAQSYLRALFLL